MKKAISVLLAVFLAFSVLAVTVVAGSEYQTFHVENLTTDSNITIVPAKGYDWYVMPGDDFKFYVEVTEGYSDSFVLVEIDTVITEPDVHGIYTIEDVQKDVTVNAFLSMEEEQSNMFASLIVFLRSILEWFANLFNGLM